MKATPQDYEIFLAGLTDAERELLAAEGIDGPPEDGAMPHSGHFEVRAEDGLPSYNKNGGTRVPDPLAESHREDDPEEAPDHLRDDLAEGLRRVFLWLLAGMSPRTLFKRPQILANRAAILCRILAVNEFDQCSLADLARLAGMSRAGFSKIAVNFRDGMDARFLVAAGDREHTRAGSRLRALRAWEHKKKIAR
jgi:AraC-like DNA-binding protein